MFCTRSVIAEIFSTFIFTSRLFLRLPEPTSCDSFSVLPCRFGRTNPRKSRVLAVLLNAPDSRSRIHLKTIPWEVAMPHYEFYCHACKKTFSKILTLVDYEEGEVLCPQCGSKNVEQRWSAFSAI